MAEDGIRLVVGLGNPGGRYEGTRHNVGFRVVESLAEEHGARWSSAAAGEGIAAQTRLSGRPVWLAKPLTFMNASGSMVVPLARFYKVEARSVLVVSDDFNLPLGRIRIRPKGSAGGQKGLDSILAQFGTLDVPRLRLGIGPVPARQDAMDFVLGRFAAAEDTEVANMVERAAQAVLLACGSGVEEAMNKYNAARGPEE